MPARLVNSTHLNTLLEQSACGESERLSLRSAIETWLPNANSPGLNGRLARPPLAQEIPADDPRFLAFESPDPDFHWALLFSMEGTDVKIWTLHKVPTVMVFPHSA